MAVDTMYDKSKYGEPLQYDPDFNGPYKRRSCTDVIFFMLFIVFVGCWIGVGVYAIRLGDPKVLLVPKDSEGSRCGLDTHVTDKPYLVFFDLTKCLQPIPFGGCRTPQVCVKECPNKQFLINNVGRYDPNDMICVNNLKPQSFSEAQRLVSEGKCAQWYLMSKPVLQRCLYNVADRRLLLNLEVSRIKGDEITLMKRYLNSSATWLALLVQNAISIFTIQRRCVPNIPKDFDLSALTNANSDITFLNLEKAKKVIQVLARAEQVGSNVIDDLIKSWWKIAACLGVALLICIIYIVLMRWFAGVMVWISIFGAIGLLSFCIYFCATKFKYYKDNPVTDLQQDYNRSVLEHYLAMKDTWLVFLIIASIVLGIILLVLLFLRKRIVLAIALISEASKAVSAVTASLFFPIFPWCLQIGVIIYAVTVALYLSTVGTPNYVTRNLSPQTCMCVGPASSYQNNNPCDPQIFLKNCYNVVSNLPCTEASCHFKDINAPAAIPYLHGFNIFGFFWLLFFVSALSEMILAGTFATWYWTFRKSDLPFFTITEATLTTLRYHVGTLAFGSLIIAICRMIRVILEYIDHKLKKFENPFTSAIMCCCKCFFWCLENFIKFINRNAYIMCAIHGKNFCISAKDSFSLLMRNVLRVFVLDKVTDFLLFLSKVLITTGVTCIAYAVFVIDIIHIEQGELNYNFVPVIVIGICTFFIASIFFSVFTMAVDTLFLCFLEDSERNDGSSEKPYYMSRSLMQILGKKNK